MICRWWIYQRERFPIAAHGLLVAVFSLCTTAFSLVVRGDSSFTRPEAPWVAFIVCFIFFFQLRVADEFKDAEEDARFRPYRPVPRGLVSLPELRMLGICGAMVQIALSTWLNPKLLIVLAVIWAYFALMSVEFFARNWLKARPLVYLFSHMLILPLVDFYAAACDWLAAGALPHRALVWFLVMSFCNGIVIELGRKIRAPQDEEAGVETYSALWGLSRACGGWLFAMLCTFVAAWNAAAFVGSETLVALTLGSVLIISCCTAVIFSRSLTKCGGKVLELLSAVWTLALYISVGGVAYALR